MSDCPGAQWNYANAQGRVKPGPGNNGFNGKLPLDEKAERLDKVVGERIKQYREETGRPPSERMIEDWYMMAVRCNNGKQL